jgi:two-component system, chemotaxis family, sensor kinase CheA
MLNSLPLKLKLLILAGVPVIGALILAYWVSSDANARLESARALGSIEDLAKLSSEISETVNALQEERAATALALGKGQDPKVSAADARAATDAKRAALERFMAARDMNNLPKRLAEELRSAQEKLLSLGKVRTDLELADANVTTALLPIDAICANLVGATAALSGLSNDGEMLRNISALVTVLELKERASQERALLGYVFAKSEYPPGGYKILVNLVTEQQVFEKVFEQATSEDLVTLYKGQLQGPGIERAKSLRETALNTMDDNFGVDPLEWMKFQGEKLSILRELTTRLNERVRNAALAKIEEARRSVNLSRYLSGSVLLVSILLAAIISLGISRSVNSLVRAAHDVQTKQDFSVRAKQVSKDELGRLTVAFNQMLEGLQTRDQELEGHRRNLEKLVEARTAELGKRNAAMRIVLDNVDQGLATIKPNGTLDAERSAIFNRWFPANDDAFANALAGSDERTQLMLQLGWDGVVEGFLPRELAVAQLPAHLERDGRHYAMSYKLMGDDESLDGALLMVTDTTDQVERRRKEAEQRELIAVFEAVMKDKSGFIEFFNETEKMCEEVVQNAALNPALAKRLVHTIKGNTAIYGVNSVAQVCHDLETACVDEERAPNATERAALESVWTSFASRVRLFANQAEDDVIELTYGDLERLVDHVKRQVPHAELLGELESLRNEPTAVRLGRIGEQAKQLCKRVGKPPVTVVVDSHGLRLPADRWGEFWASFIHVVRNALDHGIEAEEVRLAAGKPAAGIISLHSERVGDSFRIEMRDDGAGVDWIRVAEKAKSKGLPHATQSELVSALFADGLSTRDEASDLSGRGVGMSAVKDACKKLGGDITVTSQPGRGTTVRCTIPARGNERPTPFTRHPGARPSIRPPSAHPQSRKAAS